MVAPAGVERGVTQPPRSIAIISDFIVEGARDGLTSPS